MSILISAGGVVDVESGTLEPAAGVLVEGGWISAVGSVEALSGYERLDLGDAVLVPGFVDAHTHVTIRPGEGAQHDQLAGPAVWQAIRGVDNLRRMLHSGVTTARIMTEIHDIDYEFRAAIDRGEVEGPRLRVAGSGLSPPGKHGGFTGGVAGVDALREAVRERVRKGADHIKIFTTGGVSSTTTSLHESHYSAEEIRAIVSEARSAGLVVAAHAHGGAGVDLAVREGVHSIEHGALLTDDNITAMAAAGTWLVLTNTILFHPRGIEQGDAGDSAILAKLREARRSMEDVAVRIRAAGIPVAVGTDSMHGLFAYELRWMVQHGWTPQEALRAATLDGARLIGLEHEIGALKPGLRADIVALAHDPLTDITAAADVVVVIKDGTVTTVGAGPGHAAHLTGPTMPTIA